MPARPVRDRSRQKQRTRKELLRAATRLMSAGRKPTLEEVAEEALVSRATAYRYFASIDALLLEASLDVAAPEPEALFGPDAPADPLARLKRANDALDDMIADNEAPLRLMLAQTLERSLDGSLSGADGAAGKHGAPPLRQNRRTALIEAALAPAAAQFRPAALKRLKRALALVLGTESMLVFKDVLQLDEAEARKVKHWVIEALLAAAAE